MWVLTVCMLTDVMTCTNDYFYYVTQAQCQVAESVIQEQYPAYITSCVKR